MSDEQNWTTVKQESDLLIMSMITDRIGQQEVLLPINQNYDKIWEHDKIDIIISFVFPFFLYDKNHKMFSKIFFSLKEIADDFYNTYNGHHYNLLEDEVGEQSSKKRSYHNALEGLCIK